MAPNLIFNKKQETETILYNFTSAEGYFYHLSLTMQRVKVIQECVNNALVEVDVTFTGPNYTKMQDGMYERFNSIYVITLLFKGFQI